MEFTVPLKHKVIDTYTKCRRECRDQALYTGSRSYELDKAADKVVEICNHLNADPVDFIKAQFHYNSKQQYVYPTQLHSSFAEGHYKDYMELKAPKAEYKPKADFHIQKVYLKEQLKQGYKLEDVLMNDRIDFAPWFRIIITKEPNPDIIAKYFSGVKTTLNPKMLAYLEELKLDTTRL